MNSSSTKRLQCVVSGKSIKSRQNHIVGWDVEQGVFKCGQVVLDEEGLSSYRSDVHDIETDAFKDLIKLRDGPTGEEKPIYVADAVVRYFRRRNPQQRVVDEQEEFSQGQRKLVIISVCSGSGEMIKAVIKGNGHSLISLSEIDIKKRKVGFK
jgi:hypothetical protein